MKKRFNAYTQLIQKGKVRFIGASNFNAAQLRDSIDVARATGLVGYEGLAT
jgi:aryl-alcohol dehydrogenase-like predicted oxidoreductase